MESGAEDSSSGAPADNFPFPRLPVQLRDRERYHVLGEHGRGGLGRVSRVYDRELGRDVAIKELLSCDHFNEARFLREVLITARLEHPGIVPIHEAGRWPDGTPFYAMKLVAGRPLRELIAERPVGERIGLLHHIVAVADAVAYAHGRNVIHRDLKPGNIIVGEFGETIVIDWGLAKDLSDAEPLDGGGIGSGPLPTNRELTSHGAILGTPAYMAPEQARGERVDQRADVYAIGIMLWELCASEKQPPAEPRVRHRILQRADIDRDLAAIIDKAIDPAPERRYRDAGTLAADLKSFTSGVRIAARRYSLIETLAHWTRHHRTLAGSAVALVATLLIVSVIFVWNISVERDHADASEKRARTAQATSEAALAEVTLKNAELLLTTDPSATLDALATYKGSDRSRSEQIRAEAHGRGVAVLRATPHTNNVIWAAGGSDGVITTLSIDGTIARTSRDGVSAAVAHGVAGGAGEVVFAYAPSRDLLAYSCAPRDLCLFDVRRVAPIAVADAFRGISIAQIAFSPTGEYLAVGTSDGALTLYDVTAPDKPVHRVATRAVENAVVDFVDDETMVVDVKGGIALVGVSGASRFLPIAARMWATDPDGHQLAVATVDGQVALFDSRSLQPVTRSILCTGGISMLRFVPVRKLVAYECKEGTLGTWDARRGGQADPRAQLQGHNELLEVSTAGDYIVAGDSDGVVTLLDLVTGLITTYRGQRYRLMFVTPPSAAYPFTISGDVRGGIRTWPTPARLGRAVAKTGFLLGRLQFIGASSTVVASSWTTSLSVYTPSAGIRTIAGHQQANIGLTQSSTGATLASYGDTDLVELWSTATMARFRVISTGQGSVAALHFVGDGDDFITAGGDGRLIRWTTSGASAVLVQRGQLIDDFVAIPELDLVLYSTSDGALWRADGHGHGLPVRPAGGRVQQLISHPDHDTVYAAYASGDVISIDTRTLSHRVLLHSSDTIERVVITDDGRSIAVAWRAGEINFASWHDDASSSNAITWKQFVGRARMLALAPDGLLVAMFTDRTVWIYSAAVQRWLCLPLGGADLSSVAVSRDGTAAVVSDLEGRLVWIDLVMARRLLLAAVTL